MIQSGASGAGAPAAGEILRSTGHASYRWNLDSDALIWGDGAAEIFGSARAEIGSGRAFAQRVAAEAGHTRFDAVMRSGMRDAGQGVRYCIEYAFRQAPDAESVWLEDTGCWFAGADGTPAYAQGVVQVVTARHERERALITKAQFDPLTGELNRTHLIDVLSATLDEAIRFKSSCGFMVVAINNLGPVSYTHLTLPTNREV